MPNHHRTPLERRPGLPRLRVRRRLNANQRLALGVLLGWCTLSALLGWALHAVATGARFWP